MRRTIDRREFLSLCAGLAASALLTRHGIAAEAPTDIRITRIVRFDLVSRRDKVAGKNSRLDVHGDSSTDPMIRVYTDAGIEGLGQCRADEKTLTPLVGRRLSDLFKPADRAMAVPAGVGTMAFWDLLGKAQKRPVYELLGGKAARRVPAYDGSIYFADLLPQYADHWQDRFKEEIDMGLRRGHRAFKVKLGRGAKWMPAEEGFGRDKEVLKTIRGHAGTDVLLGVDMNNGYDLARTQRLLTDLPGIDLAWIEEPFPEQVDQDLALKAFIQEHKLKTLVADGETQDTLEPLRPFMEAKAIDVFQGDMNHFGTEGIMKEAAMAGPFGLQVAPHNWGSLIGFYAMLHVGCAIDNFYRAENDPVETDVVAAEGYTIKDGLATVPDSPGFGLKINEERFAATIRPRFDVK
jgi:L-alanine-DL-glutamate epimerase-like enolase superfamily enzyme